MKPGGLALTFHLHPDWNPEKQIQRDFTESTVAKKYDLMHWMVFAVMSINQSINQQNDNLYKKMGSLFMFIVHACS